MATIIYLQSGQSSPDAEERAAEAWCAAQDLHQIRVEEFRHVSDRIEQRENVDILWWHYNSGTGIPADARELEVIETIRRFLQKGGSLFLTLAAAQYVVPLGIETRLPDQIRKGTWGERSWAENYPDIRGMASFQGHPVFEGLAGGVYTWNPVVDSPYTGAIYTGTASPEQGRVIAVERQYIKLNEEKKIVCEWDVGGGRVLSVGSFLYFEFPGRRFEEHRNKFVLNCLTYLDPSGTQSSGVRTFWNFDPRTVTKGTRQSAGITIEETQLPLSRSDLAITREPESQENADFNVGGRRLLVMGKEKDGIKEIWCPPFRLTKTLKTGYRLEDGVIQWLNDMNPKVTVRPESVLREYAVGEMRIEETVFTGVNMPAGCLHYNIHSNHHLEMIVVAQIDLRLMWPYSDRATGSLQYAWDAGLRAGVVTTASGELAVIVGSSHVPTEAIGGRWTGCVMENGRLKGIDTEDIEVGIAMRIPVETGRDDITVVVAGSDAGGEEAEAAYRTAMRDPGTILANHVTYVQSLFKDSLALLTPDEEFNAGYRWALAATDRCFIETPKLGSSLIAGIGTTDRGWDGGHQISGRPGYAWYFGRDAVWTAFPMLAYGDHQKVRSVLEFLGRHQDLSGKILHELTTSGHVHYDAADSTPLYLMLMGRYLRTTGDVQFVLDQHANIERALAFCFSTDTDQDLLIENTNVGHGWVEGGQLFPVHTEIYLAACWVAALEACSFIEQKIGNHDRAAYLARKAEAAKTTIMREFWNPGTGIYNFGKLSDGSYKDAETVLSAVAYYLDCTEEGKSKTFIRRFATNAFTADWGVRILPKDNQNYNPRGYHSGSVWPLFTGWASLAEFRANRPVQGWMHCVSTMMLYKKWAAGTIEEVLHGELLEPAGVCSHQGWSESMILQPLLEGMLGISCDSSDNLITFRPYLLPHWRSAEVRNIRCGESIMNVSMKKEHDTSQWTFHLLRGDPVNVRFSPLFSPGTRIRFSDGSDRRNLLVKSYGDAPTMEFTLKKEVTKKIDWRGGLSVIPAVHLPAAGKASEGIRIVDEQWTAEEAVIHCEGREGSEYSLLLWDPAATVVGISDGVLSDRKNGTLVIKTSFPKSEPPGSYSSKTIKLTLTS